MNKNKAVFIDRDGTIIQDIGYESKWDRKLLIPGSIEAIKLLNEKRFKVIIVTNQAGVAKGYFTEEDVILFHKLMKEYLKSKGAIIDAIYHCPHSPDDSCDCRKPKPGMLKKAEKEFNIGLSSSYMIGDKKSDIDTGKSAGCKIAILVLTGHGTRELENNNYNINCDFVAENLYDAVMSINSKWIITI